MESSEAMDPQQLGNTICRLVLVYWDTSLHLPRAEGARQLLADMERFGLPIETGRVAIHYWTKLMVAETMLALDNGT